MNIWVPAALGSLSPPVCDHVCLSLPASLPVWLTVPEPSRGQFHVCTKHNCFLWNECEHHSGTPFAFSWDTQPGAECLFDHSPFLYCKYIHFHLWGRNPGDEVCETCGFLSRSLAERSSTWSWCRWSCPGVLCSWNHWRIPDLGGNTQMKNAAECWNS